MSINRSLNSVLQTFSGTLEERRAAVQLEEQEKAALRQQEIEAQSSALHDAQERIRIWERLHMLRLPLSAGHGLVRVIAAQTHLSVNEIHAEQQRRAGLAPHS